MSTWRDRSLEVGYFRTVRFCFESVEAEIGRRTQLTEFPGRDQPFVEDLGLRTRKFTIEMFVVGPNYDYERDLLRQALETPGPGQLDHPYWGAMQVTVDGPVRVRETTREGGVARFTVTFVEAGADLQLVSEPDPVTAVIFAAIKVDDLGASRLAAAVSVAADIAGTVAAAVQAVQSVCTTLNKIRGKIAAAMQVIDDVKAAIDEIADTAAEILNTPQVLAAKLHAVCDSILGAITKISNAVQALQDFFGGASGSADVSDVIPSAGNALLAATKANALARATEAFQTTGDDLAGLPENTPTQEVIATNQREIVRFVQLSGVTAIARTAVAIKFDNLSQAEEVRDLTLELIDQLLLDDTLTDELYIVLVELRATLVAYLTSVIADLPSLVDYTPNVTLPALVIAFQIYGDPTREAEIVVRNPQMRDPSAVPGGQPIQVLIDG